MNAIEPTKDAHEPVETGVAEGIIELVERLIAVVDAENRDLAGGLPASVAAAAVDKSRLADELRRRIGTEFRRDVVVRTAPEVRSRLIERAGLLERLTQENMVRLEAAIVATRRRVDAVMRAIREQMSRDAHAYGANGRLPHRPAPPPARRGYLA